MAIQVGVRGLLAYAKSLGLQVVPEASKHHRWTITNPLTGAKAYLPRKVTGNMNSKLKNYRRQIRRIAEDGGDAADRLDH